MPRLDQIEMPGCSSLSALCARTSESDDAIEGSPDLVTHRGRKAPLARLADRIFFLLDSALEGLVRRIVDEQRRPAGPSSCNVVAVVVTGSSRLLPQRGLQR